MFPSEHIKRSTDDIEHVVEILNGGEITSGMELAYLLMYSYMLKGQANAIQSKIDKIRAAQDKEPVC